MESVMQILVYTIYIIIHISTSGGAKWLFFDSSYVTRLCNEAISPTLLKLAAAAIADSLTKICNLSICQGIFPSQWKNAKVNSIHKKGSLSEKGTYRPISIIATLSKIMVRHVHDSLYQYLSARNLIYIAQIGFWRFDSCETALSRLLDIWTTNMEIGNWMV